MPITYHPTRMTNPLCVPIKQIVLDLSGNDIDLTDPDGPTGGYCAAALLIGDTAGAVKFKSAITGAEATTQDVDAFQLLQGGVQYVYSTANGTTADTVTVLL